MLGNREGPKGDYHGLRWRQEKLQTSWSSQKQTLLPRPHKPLKQESQDGKAAVKQGVDTAEGSVEFSESNCLQFLPGGFWPLELAGTPHSSRSLSALLDFTYA